MRQADTAFVWMQVHDRLTAGHLQVHVHAQPYIYEVHLSEPLDKPVEQTESHSSQSIYTISNNQLIVGKTMKAHDNRLYQQISV
jgi:hypothetical protein